MNGRLARALLAFLALPGTVAFLVPLLLFAPNGTASFVDPLGLVPLTVGIALLLWCVREFYVVGRGTLAPWSPPEAIVTTGPYQFSRNPMYIAVLLVLWGWAIGFQSWPLVIYALAIMVAFQLRVRFFEEPWLERTFRASWPVYRARVPRWIGLRDR
jgi:protein-S-isoprenylcysteine O-methyltransferase Ste14